jgi:chaperone required for assembly of F1-ATPase
VAVEGILPARQPPESIDAVRRHAESLDDFRLTGLVHAVSMFGSAVIGLAVEQRRLKAVEAHAVARVDEDYQESQWGQDAEAARRTERTRSEAAALDLWFDAL